MEQLLNQLSTEYNLTLEEVTGIVTTVKNYLAANTNTTEQTVTTAEAVPVAEVKEESMLEKAEDFVKDHIPEGLKEKASEVFSGVGNKIKGLFN